jgi:hypothetical protein
MRTIAAFTLICAAPFATVSSDGGGYKTIEDAVRTLGADSIRT